MDIISRELLTEFLAQQTSVTGTRAQYVTYE